MTTIESKTEPKRDLERMSLLVNISCRLALAGSNDLRVVERVLERLELRRERDTVDDLADELVDVFVDLLEMEDAEVERRRAETLDQIVPRAAPAQPDMVDVFRPVR